jgi:hypothetical protein
MKNKYREIDADLLLLAAQDTDRSRQEAAERIRKMSAEERSDLRAAMQQLDYLLDDVYLEMSREKRARK